MTKAIIYTAPECPHSQALKNFLLENEIEFEEKCVLDSVEVFDEMVEKSQQKGIPVTVLESRVFVGFDHRVERRMKRILGE